MASGGGNCRGTLGDENFIELSNSTLDKNDDSLLSELIDVHNLKLDDADEGNW